MTDNEQLLFTGAMLVNIAAFCIITLLAIFQTAPVYVQESIQLTVSFGVGLSVINGLFGTLFMGLGSAYCFGSYILSMAGAQ